ncbi:YbaB/EbfC family nucleoid-associated protein [Nocardia asteroides]|uniref:YbaB/EbfC family nucleoid-associated protein n=1 Tax=Nocardia asteroides TaxID=1824 RepID=UPI0034309F30
MTEEADNARLEYLQEVLLRIRGTASTGDSSVTVEAGANGALHSVRLSESGRRLDPQQLVDHIVALHRLAHAEAGDAMRAALEDHAVETSTADEIPQTGDDPDVVDAGSDITEETPTESPEPAPPNDERPEDETSPQQGNPPPSRIPESPDLSPAAHDRFDDAVPGLVARETDPDDHPAHLIRAHEPIADTGDAFDVIAPGEDNPYAAVIAESPSPRRVPLPGRARQQPDIGAEQSGPPALCATPDDLSARSGPDCPSIHDYLRFDNLWHDDLWYRSHWDA